MPEIISVILLSSSSRQFTGITCLLYSLESLQAKSLQALLFGFVLLRRTTNGLFSAVNSSITRFSASAYSFLGICVILPSVVTTSPIVECSSITFFVPISAARLNGISSSLHGVITILGASSSKYPSLLGTI